MNCRKFGNTNLNVSEIGFGAWAIGGPAMAGDVPIGWGIVDERESLDALRESMNQGVNFIDTADFYGFGRSEELIGKLVGNDPNIIIASKLGQRLSKDKKIYVDYSSDYIKKACQASLRRLKRDYIDFYQLHTAKVSDLRDGDCVEAMESLKKDGLIRYWGVSLNTFSPEEEANYIISNNLGSGLQVVFNILNHKALDVIKNANNSGFGIIARMPFQFGLLTGKFSVSSKFDKNDHRSVRLKQSFLQKILPELDLFFEICEQNKIEPAKLALSYILGYEGISTVIPGMKNSRQAKLNTSEPYRIKEEDFSELQSHYTAIIPRLLRLLQAAEK